MNAPLASLMSLRLDGDSMLQPNGYGRTANGSFGDLLASLNGMPIVNAAGAGQQLWIDDAMIPGPVRPLVIIPLQRYFHPIWKQSHPTHTDALVDSFRSIDEQVASEFGNVLPLDIYRNTTDAMYADDWAHLNDAGHLNALDNLIADTSALALSYTL